VIGINGGLKVLGRVHEKLIVLCCLTLFFGEIGVLDGLVDVRCRLSPPAAKNLRPKKPLNFEASTATREKKDTTITTNIHLIVEVFSGQFITIFHDFLLLLTNFYSFGIFSQKSASRKANRMISEKIPFFH